MFKKLIALLFLMPMTALATQFIEGKDYQTVASAQLSTNKDKTPLITEFFSYGCPWCYKIDAPLNDWATRMGKSANLSAFQLFLNQTGICMPKPITQQKPWLCPIK